MACHIGRAMPHPPQSCTFLGRSRTLYGSCCAARPDFGQGAACQAGCDLPEALRSGGKWRLWQAVACSLRSSTRGQQQAACAAGGSLLGAWLGDWLAAAALAGLRSVGAWGGCAESRQRHSCCRRPVAPWAGCFGWLWWQSCAPEGRVLEWAMAVSRLAGVGPGAA